MFIPNTFNCISVLIFSVFAFHIFQRLLIENQVEERREEVL